MSSNIDTSVYNFMIAYKQAKGVYPDKKWLASKCKISEQEVLRIQNDLVKEGKLKITRRGAEVQNTKEVKNKLFTIEFIMFLACLLISVICIVISTHYSLVFISSFLPGFLGVLLAVGTVLYSTVFLEIALYTLKEKGAKYKVFSGIVSVVGFIVMLSSMLFTVAGQYNTLQEKQVTRQTDILHLLNQEIEDKKIQILKAEKDKEMYRRVMLDVAEDDRKTNGGGYYITSRNDFEKASVKADALNKEKIEIEKNIKELVKNEKVSIQKKTFSFWLAALLPFTGDQISFFLKLLFGLFVDIGAPLCLVAALFFYKRR